MSLQRAALIVISSGLAIWLLYFVLVYLVLDFGCSLRSGGTWTPDPVALRSLVLALTLGTLVLIGAAAAWGWRRFARVGQDARAAGASPFHAFAGPLTVLVATLAAIATVWTGLPALMVPPCR